MDLDLPAKSTVFFEGKLTFTLNVHIDLVSGCAKVLVFTHGTDHSYYFPGSFFCHIGGILAWRNLS